MPIAVAEWLVRIAGFYLLVGICFAIPFVLVGVGRIDPSARASTRGFKLVIVPGVVLLWPLLARRLMSGESSPPPEDNPHRRAASAGAQRDAEKRGQP